MNTSNILSFVLSGHGFSGAVCVNGQIVVATTLERLTRKKYDILLPLSQHDLDTLGWTADPKVYQDAMDVPFDLSAHAIDLSLCEPFHTMLDYLLTAASLTMPDVETVVWSYRHTDAAQRYFARYYPHVQFIGNPEHHATHAAQAFLPSPFDDAAILVVDGQGIPLARVGGDQLAGCLAYGSRSASITMLEDIPVRHSLGGMYAAFTTKCGFKTNEDGKTMGLAAYGTPTYYQPVTFDAYESLRATLSGLRHGRWPTRLHYQLPRYWELLEKCVRRKSTDPMTSEYQDLAYAAQHMVEEVMIHLGKYLREYTGSKNLCIAGGVGLNCVANAKVLKACGFEHIYIPSSPGDNGLVVGQALALAGKLTTITDRDDWGQSYSKPRVEQAMATTNLPVQSLNVTTVAQAIANGKVVGWYQGRSEFGPRALGHRSILADPRKAYMKDYLNASVKFREAFRPYTPSCLAEHAHAYFDLSVPSPFMLLAPEVHLWKRREIPAVTHVDGTARVQTVTPANGRYYDLITAFHNLTGVPMVLNTSFNVAGEPMVETPEDAVRCFQSTALDILVMDEWMVTKHAQ